MRLVEALSKHLEGGLAPASRRNPASGGWRTVKSGARGLGSRRTLGSPVEALSDCARLKVKKEGRWTIGPPIPLRLEAGRRSFEQILFATHCGTDCVPPVTCGDLGLAH
jgi:hypothetical protein